ncbi:MAG TPA: hypothetical protein VEB20_21855 [Azospirillaceae bacterium]|nr:hypothetical protein [Azospirillaceae bacterium]
MTDHTLHDTSDASGFFAQTGRGFFGTLVDDFRAVPGEAWIILAVATVMSNLFIALA